MSDLEQKEPGEYCNARKTDGSGYCQHEAGWGTDHSGVGRCKFHGGSTPDQEQGIINDLKDAADDGAIALRLRLKQAREKAEAGEFDDIDWGEIDRHARTVWDRTPDVPNATSKHELENTGDEPLSDVTIDFNNVDT